MSPQNQIVALLDQARAMQIATAANNQPWCATVFFAHDNAHNLYWISLPESRHSQDIASNKFVSGAVTLVREYGEPLIGLQFEGEAQQITDPDHIRQFSEAYAERYNRYSLADDILNNATPYGLYQLKPTLFVLFDQQHFPDSPHQEWRPQQTTSNS